MQYYVMSQRSLNFKLKFQMGIFCISLYAILFFSSTIIIIGLCSQINPSIEDLIQNLNSNLNLNQKFKMLKT